ncbi:MAG: hypothetical protein ACPLSY_03315 [Moorellaceae bacterium]
MHKDQRPFKGQKCQTSRRVGPQDTRNIQALSADGRETSGNGTAFQTKISSSTDPGKAAGSIIKALMGGRPSASAVASGTAVENFARTLSLAQKFAAANGKRLQVKTEIIFMGEES